MNSQIQGWFDFQNIYDRAVEEAQPGDILIELGVWKGLSLCHLALRAKIADKNLKVIGIDNWKHTDWDGYHAIIRRDMEAGEHRTPFQQCVANLQAAGVYDDVTLFESDTIEAASMFEDKRIRFLFVDDTHTDAHIEKELRAWLPKIIPGAWIAGHDYPGCIVNGVKTVFPNAVQDGTSWVAYV